MLHQIFRLIFISAFTHLHVQLPLWIRIFLRLRIFVRLIIFYVCVFTFLVLFGLACLITSKNICTSNIFLIIYYYLEYFCVNAFSCAVTFVNSNIFTSKNICIFDIFYICAVTFMVLHALGLAYLLRVRIFVCLIFLRLYIYVPCYLVTLMAWSSSRLPLDFPSMPTTVLFKKVGHT